MTIRFRKRAVSALTAAFLMLGATAAEASRFQMSYLYFGKTSEYAEQVARADSALQVVSPSYFDLDPDGSLRITDKLDRAFIDQMHRQGVKVVPFLSNHWDRATGVNALEKRDALVRDIADAVSRYDLDGVNVDIENVTETSRDAYTELVKKLRETLPADREVSVAVSANPKGWTKGWHGSYDYAALAKVSDYLMIMTYDETSIGDPDPGPVASLPFVERSIRYALQFAPAERIVLGLPYYGRFWKTDGTWNGDGISNAAVDSLVARFGGTTVYDEPTQSAVSTVTIPAGVTPPVVNYKTLTPGTYTIWHENEQSMKRKLELVEKYGLKGTGSWSLGQESGNTWSYMTLWVNGAFFEDAQGHWAMGDIASVASHGWMNGTAPNRFSPELPLTRAQAAAILVRAMLGQRSADDAPKQSAFSDVPSAHWASREIAAAKQAGMIDGIGADRFAPDETITREQMAAMLSRALKLSSSAGASASFTDVRSSDWSYVYVQALSERGILQGIEPGLFRPAQPILRSQMAALMNRLSSLIPERS